MAVISEDRFVEAMAFSFQSRKKYANPRSGLVNHARLIAPLKSLPTTSSLRGVKVLRGLADASVVMLAAIGVGRQPTHGALQRTANLLCGLITQSWRSVRAGTEPASRPPSHAAACQKGGAQLGP